MLNREMHFRAENPRRRSFTLINRALSGPRTQRYTLWLWIFSSEPRNGSRPR
jgi:hypothetical protein